MGALPVPSMPLLLIQVSPPPRADAVAGTCNPSVHICVPISKHNGLSNDVLGPLRVRGHVEANLVNQAFKTRHEVKKPELLNTGSKEVEDMRDVYRFIIEVHTSMTCCL